MSSRQEVCGADPVRITGTRFRLRALFAILVPLAASSLLCRPVAARGQNVAARPPRITYDLRLDAQRARHFAVRITAPRTLEPQQDFAIPAWTPGYYQILHFESGIDRVRAEDEEGHRLALAHPDARTWTVSTAGAIGRTVTLSYDVAGADKGLGFFGSMLDVPRQIGYVNGASAFMYLPGHTQAPVSLSVTLPAGWKCATPLDTRSPETYIADSYDELIDCPLQLGRFSSFAFQVGSTPFQAIVVGDRRFAPQRVSAALAKVVGEAIGVFGSVPFRKYVFFYHIGEAGFTGGLEHRNSTVIHLDDPIGDGDDDDFLTTSTHEFFHAWNVKRLRPVGLGPFDYAKPVRTPSLWFAEGVTDYYADLLPVRAGLRPISWLLEQIVQRIHQLDVAPARVRVTLEQASNQAWEGQSEGFGGLSYYLKGGLLGCYFDLRIRSATHSRRSLDDVMRLLDHIYGEHNLAYPARALSDAISQTAGMDLSADYRRYTSTTDDINWSDVLPDAGLILRRQVDGQLGVSFTPEIPEGETDDRDNSDRTATVQHVEIGFPAAAMDLRPGDQIVAINGREVTYGIAGALVRSLPPDTPVRIAVNRQGRTFTLLGTAGSQYSHHTLKPAPAISQTAETRRELQAWFASRAGTVEPLPQISNKDGRE